MIFGMKNVRNDLGVFSSDKCSACKDSYTYHFFKITRFFVVFFVNLIPVRTHYEAVCEGCEDTRAIDSKTGRGIAKENFKKRSRSLAAKTALKMIAAALIIAAAVAAPLTIHIAPDTDSETLKSLVSEDGLYGIQNSDGDVLAVIQVTEGVKTMTFYDDTSVLVGEPGADGSFTKHEYRQEATNDTQTDGNYLVRVPDDPGMLEDRYGTAVRVYHYDSENDAMGYSIGVEDLSTITYTADKITYPFRYYSSDSDDPSNYQLTLYLLANKQLEATFIPELASDDTDQFVMLTVKDLSGGRIQTETRYNFDENTIVLGKAAGLSAQSSAQDILDFLEQAAPTPTMSTDYEYYKNTKVVSVMTLSIGDSNGDLQSVTQAFDVTVKNGYYIVQTAEEEQ